MRPILFAVVPSVFAALAIAGEPGVDFRTDVFVRGTDGYHTNRIPVMVITRDGKILCAFEDGTRDYCEKISVVQVSREWLLAGNKARENQNYGAWRDR